MYVPIVYGFLPEINVFEPTQVTPRRTARDYSTCACRCLQSAPWRRGLPSTFDRKIDEARKAPIGQLARRLGGNGDVRSI